MALPSGYIKLAYIESTGTQYINVGFVPNNNTKAICDAELISGTNNISVPFGTYESGSNRFALMYHHQLGWTHWVGGASGQCAGEQLGRHTFTLTGTSLVVDSATKTFTTAAFTGSVPMFIFGINYQGSLDYAASMRLYSCQIYDNGTLVRDFVPCKNASGVVGLYDLKNGAFYSNAGTGTFSYGEVEPTGDHRTMVDGVIWGIPSGRCLVDGVGYSIQKGRTLVDGVGYDVAFGEASATVTIKGHGNSSYYGAGEATINGTRYTGRSSPLTLDVEIGTEIVCQALTPSQLGFSVYDSAEIMLNGKTVKSGYSGNVTYTYVVVGNTEISLGLVGDAGQVRIVEL